MPQKIIWFALASALLSALSLSLSLSGGCMRRAQSLIGVIILIYLPQPAQMHVKKEQIRFLRVESGVQAEEQSLFV
jgi:hypothetical protein